MIETCPHCLKLSFTWEVGRRICLRCGHIFAIFKRDYYHYKRSYVHE